VTKEKQKAVTKTSIIKIVEKPVKQFKEEMQTVNDQINSDMSALGLESNIPKIPKVVSTKRRVRLDVKEEAEKRSQEKLRLNIVVIGMIHPDTKNAQVMLIQGNLRSWGICCSNWEKFRIEFLKSLKRILS
jgi:hypothetical protein